MDEHPHKKVSFSFGNTSGPGNHHPPPVQFYVGSRRSSIVKPGLPVLLVELYDHRAQSGGEESEWIQMARWIKYEEDVEGVDQHWGRPHVPFLSYHAVQKLITYMRDGVVLLDVEAFNFGDISCALTEALCERYEANDKSASAFLATLQQKNFRRPSENGRKFSMAIGSHRKPTQQEFASSLSPSPDESRKSSSINPTRPSIQIQLTPIGEDPIPIILDDEEPPTPSAAATSTNHHLSINGPRTSITNQSPSAPMSVKRKLSQQLSHLVTGGGGGGKNSDVLLDEGSEAAQIFAGILPEITEPRFGMVRLKESILIPECHEHVPIRFMFLIVGPSLPDLYYHDLGRAIGPLMANATFREVAYSAADRQTLIRGLYEFLDSSVLIPPADIQTKDLVHVDDVRKALRQRKLQKEEAKRQSELAPRDSLPSISDGLIHQSSSINNLEIPIVLDTREAIAKIAAGKLIGSLSPDDDAHDRFPWERTRRPFGGMIKDLKNRAAYYWSDYRDALNVQCISSIIFMFFVTFSPAISFGQVMNERLEGYIGITEVFVAQAICGVIWGLFGGQPLLIQAATGPFLVFETALFEFCKSNQLEFLTVRVWVGLWTFLLSIVMVMVEASFLIGYVTRFTQDIFTTLIAGIFVYQAWNFVERTFIAHGLLTLPHYCSLSIDDMDWNRTMTNGSLLDDDLVNGTLPIVSPSSPRIQPNTALLSMIFVLATFYMAYVLKKIRTSHYFGRTIRKALGDFGVPVTIIFMVGLYHLVFSKTFLQMADMPTTFGLTQPDKRPWFIHPLGYESALPNWVIYATIVPALLVSILLFAEIEIIELLLFNKDRGLQKPMGFHWDLVLCGGLMFASSLFGLPWMCAAAVQSLTHATSLTIMRRAAPGEVARVDRVVEQRVTTIVVSIMIGACSFLGSILRTIPIAVLLGVFLYLGISCLLSIQFIHRVILLLIPRKYFPDQPYCKEVSMWRMHTFTLLQLLGFVALWTVNIINQSSLAFPFVIALDAAARRYLLPRIFTQRELNALDPSDNDRRSQIDDDQGDVYDEVAMPM